MVNNDEIPKDVEFLATGTLTVENNYSHQWPGNIS